MFHRITRWASFRTKVKWLMIKWLSPRKWLCSEVCCNGCVFVVVDVIPLEVDLNTRSLTRSALIVHDDLSRALCPCCVISFGLTLLSMMASPNTFVVNSSRNSCLSAFSISRCDMTIMYDFPFHT